MRIEGSAYTVKLASGGASARYSSKYCTSVLFEHSFERRSGFLSYAADVEYLVKYYGQYRCYRQRRCE